MRWCVVRSPFLWLPLLLVAIAPVVAADDIRADDIRADDIRADDVVPADDIRADELRPVASPEAAPETTFLDQVSVTATRSERAVRDTPGRVDLVERREMERRGATGLEDLVRFLPGVDVDGDPTRLGTNGFSIRGIGGNRVLTEVDGVPSAEQFDFGPLSIHQVTLDVDSLESVEIVRSAGSSLYGSDALGGVVALTTRSARSYLSDGSPYVGLRVGYDGRSDEATAGATVAVGDDRWQGSLLYSRRDGAEVDSQGTIETDDSSRTLPNPIDREQDDALLKVSFTPTAEAEWRLSAERYESTAETSILSSIGPGSPFASAILDADSLDEQERSRLSLSHQATRSTRTFDTVLARLYAQSVDTEQTVTEIRQPSAGISLRESLLTFEQDTLGVRAELRKVVDSALLTYGAEIQRDRFDQLRDRAETLVDGGAPVPTTLAFPSKYFPTTDVQELGAFLQAEVALFGGRLSLVPGVRYDRFDLDADQDDLTFIAGNPGTPTPVDLTEDAVSPKLGVVFAVTERVSVSAQYARGFRAPPMSDVNNGFTNRAGGYRTLPNPDLEPETSDNLDIGIRATIGRLSLSAAAFENRFDEFIELTSLGFDPATFLVEFQPRNVQDVEISGVELEAELDLDHGWSLRGSYASIEGTDESDDEPLESIAPPQLVLGARYLAPTGRWGAELLGTATEAKDGDDLPTGSTQFRAPSSEVVDVFGWIELRSGLRLQLSAWNLTDETFWRWPFVRGQRQGSPTIDRYSSPGRSVGAQLRYIF